MMGSRVFVINGIMLWLDCNLYWLVPSLISAIIPLAVMFVTLRSEKSTSRKQLQESKKQFQQSLQQAKEKARIEIMPFITMELADIRPKYTTDLLSFSIELQNSGNNSAVNLHLHRFETKLSNEKMQPRAVYEDKLFQFFYYEEWPLDINILKVGERGIFEIEVNLNALIVEGNPLKDWNEYCVDLIVEFDDLKRNHYTQEISFRYRLDNWKVSLMERKIYAPVLKSDQPD